MSFSYKGERMELSVSEMRTLQEDRNYSNREIAAMLDCSVATVYRFIGPKRPRKRKEIIVMSNNEKPITSLSEAVEVVRKALDEKPKTEPKNEPKRATIAPVPPYKAMNYNYDAPVKPQPEKPQPEKPQFEKPARPAMMCGMDMLSSDGKTNVHVDLNNGAVAKMTFSGRYNMDMTFVEFCALRAMLAEIGDTLLALSRRS